MAVVYLGGWQGGKSARGAISLGSTFFREANLTGILF